MTQCADRCVRAARGVGRRFGGVLGLYLTLGMTVCAEAATTMVWPDTIEAIAGALGSNDLAKRRAAAARIAELPRTAAHRLLPKALRDADGAVRVIAAGAAVRTRYVAAADVVGAWLGDTDPAVRRAAARVLGEFPERNTSVAQLARALGDPEHAVRLEVVHALGSSRDPAAAPALLAQLDDSHPAVAVAVVEALEQLEDPRAVVALISRIADPRAATRRAVVRALGALGSDTAVGALVLALRDSDAGVRQAVVAALGRTRSQLGVEALHGVVTGDSSVEVSVAALHALVEIGSPEAIHWVVEQLDSDRDELTKEAARALQQLGVEGAPALQRCLTSQPSRTRADACALAMATTNAPASFEAIASAWRSRTVSERGALVATGRLGDARGLPSVLEQLGSSDPAVRLAAVRSTELLLDPARPDGRAVEPIERALSAVTQSTEERVAFVNLLGLTGAARAASTLVPFTAAGVPVNLRLAAIRALGRVGPTVPMVEATLLGCLDDNHGPVRFEAARALRRAGDKRLVSTLLVRLESAAMQDREALALALAGPASRAPSAQWVPRVLALIQKSQPRLQAALVEVLAQGSSPESSAALLTLVAHSPALRAKVAEVWGFQARSAKRAPEALLRLLNDPLASVRANAAWSVFELRTAAAADLLEALVADPDAGVAANAVAALSRVAQPERVVSVLCSALEDRRATVRANALTGLSARGIRCASGVERWLLRSDPSVLVRARAAWLLARYPSEAAPLEAKMLRRCQRVEPSSRVAKACGRSGAPVAPAEGVSGVTVFIVPEGRTKPSPGAPYTLDVGTGTLRSGIADSRGAVFVGAPADATLRLEISANRAQ